MYLFYTIILFTTIFTNILSHTYFIIITFTNCNGRLAGKKVDFTLDMRLGVREGGKIEITSSDLNVELKDIHAELECLFPRRGKCCPRKYLKSCNTILAKTVLRWTCQYQTYMRCLMNAYILLMMKVYQQWRPELHKEIRARNHAADRPHSAELPQHVSGNHAIEQYTGWMSVWIIFQCLEECGCEWCNYSLMEWSI